MIPKYLSIYNDITKEIRTGQLKRLGKLMTEAEYCRKYNCSRQTIRRCLQMLKDNNFITSRQGGGYYVCANAAEAFTQEIAILLSHDNAYIYPSLINDITTELQSSPYIAKIYITNNKIQNEREILLRFLTNPPAAVLAEPVRSFCVNPNTYLYEQLRKQDTKILFFLGTYPMLSHFPSLQSDDVGGGELLTRTLLAKNHKKIGGIFPADDYRGTKRCSGYMNTLLENYGNTFEDADILWFNSNDMTALRNRNNTSFFTEYIRRTAKTCTAYICYNDEIAYWFIKELQHFGYNVPNDISIVSFDNSYLSDFSDVKITSLSHILHEPGKSAARLLLKMLNNQPVESSIIPWTLEEKQSLKEI